jgi:hypothetical protein
MSSVRLRWQRLPQARPSRGPYGAAGCDGSGHLTSQSRLLTQTPEYFERFQIYHEGERVLEETPAALS